MKVSDIIKTPVAAWSQQYPSGLECGVSDATDMTLVCGLTLDKEEATTIAHCINSHDALVDMVRRLREVLSVATNTYFDHQVEAIIREADELLKGEQWPTPKQSMRREMAKRMTFPLKFDKLISDDILVENNKEGTFVCRKAGPSEWWCIKDWKLRHLVQLANKQIKAAQRKAVKKK